MPGKKKMNAKKKSKKGSSKGGAGPRQQIPNSKVVSRVAPKKANRMPHVHAICSITDPFCVHARGAQRPDGGPPSIPFQYRNIIEIKASGITGASRYTFVPNPLFQYLAAGIAANVWTNAAAWLDSGGSGFVNTNAKELRIVSFGVIIRSAMTATTAKGFVITSVEPNPTVNGTASQGSLQATESQLITLAAGMEHTWVSKPLGSTAHMFKPKSGFTSTMSDFDWTSLVVEVNGSDTTSAITLLTAEVVMNVEFTVDAGGGSSSVAQLQKTPPLPNNAAVSAASHSIATRPSFIQGGIEKAGTMIAKQAKSSLDTILEDGMALLFGM